MYGRWHGSWKALTPELARIGTMNRAGRDASPRRPPGQTSFAGRAGSTTLPIHGSWNVFMFLCTRIVTMNQGEHRPLNAASSKLEVQRWTLDVRSGFWRALTPELARIGTMNRSDFRVYVVRTSEPKSNRVNAGLWPQGSWEASLI